METEPPQQLVRTDAASPRRNNGRFAPGHSGNPGGRPKGAKDRINKMRDCFLAIFEELGPNALKQFAAEDPKTFYSLMSKMLPRHSDIAVEDHRDEIVPIVLVSGKTSKSLVH